MFERRTSMLAAIAGVALLILVSATFSIVPETKQGVVLRFGQPIKVFNVYHAGERFGATGAGILTRIPFFDRVVWVDKRVRDIDMERQQVISTDQLRLNIDAFARYRITNPLRMVITAGTEENLTDALKPNLGSALRNELGKRRFAELLSPERGIVMNNIRIGLDRVARQYGAEIVDVRIKKADLPDGTPLTAAYDSMRSARQQQALTIRAQGFKRAQIIRADADAQAAGIYAEAYGKDPEFYDFYRAMQSYERTFGTDGSSPQGGASIILSPSNDYLRQFRGGGSGK
ncbi:MAG TPA: protease modulator HflC [Sphingomonas sp.]|jgi:membrane protease subunit HflC|nr:protease modulator HflC [Sphingomonas sp.]